jgi:hypothetical protein
MKRGNVVKEDRKDGLYIDTCPTPNHTTVVLLRSDKYLNIFLAAIVTKKLIVVLIKKTLFITELYSTVFHHTVFARSNAGIMGSNPNHGMNVCVCVYSMFVLSCVLSSGLATG